MIRHDRTFARSESVLARALLEAGSSPQTLVRTISEILARDIRESSVAGTSLLSTISALAFGASRAAARAGGNAELVAQGFMLGVMLASERRERRQVLAVVSHAAGTFIKHTREAGGDAAAAARGLAGGAAAWAAESRVGAAEAACAAGQGAVDAAEDLDAASARKVRDAVTAAPIAGVWVTLNEESRV